MLSGRKALIHRHNDDFASRSGVCYIFPMKQIIAHAALEDVR